MFAGRARQTHRFAAAILTAVGIACMPHAGLSANGDVETGTVLDLDSGAPIAGARIVLSRDLLPDGQAAQLSTSAVTAADGSYTVADVPPGPMTVQILPQAGYPALHRRVDVGPGENRSRLAVAKPTVLETAWLRRINTERAAYGERAVVFDQGAIQSARYWASYMARHHYFAHAMPNADPDADAPGDDTPVTRYLKFSGLDLTATSGMSENIAEFDGPSTYADAEDMFMAERAKCPHEKPEGCAFTEETGHFLNILNPDFRWVGLGVSHIGDQTYFDQEFVVGA